MRKHIALLLGGLLLPVGHTAAQQQSTVGPQDATPEQEARARRISDQLMSPFCPGRTLNECPSPSAAEWREDIRGWVAEGVEAPEIRRRLEARAPEADLTGDPGRGSAISPLLWIALAALAVPAVVLLPLVRKRRRREAAEMARRDEEEGVRDDALEARLERELEAFDS